MAMQEDEKFTGKRIFLISLMAASLQFKIHSLAVMDWRRTATRAQSNSPIKARCKAE
jgi:hypothetical protein